MNVTETIILIQNIQLFRIHKESDRHNYLYDASQLTI
jgi:hypothetical protein